MTKFILHGGFPKEVKKFDNALFEALQNDVPDKGIVLLVYFAKPAEFYLELYNEHLPYLKIASHGRELNYLLADEQKFMEQIKQADSLYLAGGDSLLLLEKIKHYPEFADSIRGKTVLGSSAGANILGKYFYSVYAKHVLKGLGVLAVVIRPHDNREQKIYDELKSKCQDCQLIALKEFEMKILEV